MSQRYLQEGTDFVQHMKTPRACEHRIGELATLAPDALRDWALQPAPTHFLRRKHTSREANPILCSQRLLQDFAVATSCAASCSLRAIRKKEQHYWHKDSSQSGHAVADAPLRRPTVSMARAVAQDRQFWRDTDQSMQTVRCLWFPLSGSRIRQKQRGGAEDGTSSLKVAQARQCALRNCIRFWLTWRKGRCASTWSRRNVTTWMREL